MKWLSWVSNPYVLDSKAHALPLHPCHSKCHPWASCSASSRRLEAFQQCKCLWPTLDLLDQNLHVVHLCIEVREAPFYTTLPTQLLTFSFPRKQAHSCGPTIHRRLSWIWKPSSNQTCPACWVGILSSSRSRLSFLRPWALCIYQAVTLTGANVPVRTPSSLTAIQSKALESQKMLGRFCPNIPCVATPDPQWKNESVLVLLERKEYTNRHMWNPAAMKSQDNLNKTLL